MDIKRFCISLCVPLALAVAAGCSVKEERGGCPCYLTVTFDGSAQVMDSEGITSLKLDVRMTDADQDCGSVSCEELDFLNRLARKMDVTGSRVMGGGFGGCTINLVKDSLYDAFISEARKQFKARFGHEPKVYDVVVSDGAREIK